MIKSILSKWNLLTILINSAFFSNSQLKHLNISQSTSHLYTINTSIHFPSISYFHLYFQPIKVLF